MSPRWLTPVLATSLTLAMASATQGQTTQLATGARIRYDLSGPGTDWRSGRLVSFDHDSLIVARGDAHVVLDLRDVTALQTRRRSGRGALIGLGIGAIVAPSIVSALADTPGSSDLVGVAVLGGLVGAAWGSGRPSRVLGGWGLLLGAAIGAVALGTTRSACESSASDLCHFVVGGTFVGAIGLTIGSAVGMLIPNWVPVFTH